MKAKIKIIPRFTVSGNSYGISRISKFMYEDGDSMFMANNIRIQYS